MSGGLGLVPNEVVGWRIKPDWYNFTVVLVKKHGPGSAKAGQEYETPYAYCKSLESAASWIFTQSMRVDGQAAQDVVQASTGSVADIHALAATAEVARNQVLRSVTEFAEMLKGQGLSAPKDFAKFLTGESTAPTAALLETT